jgi:hypothetical protein
VLLATDAEGTQQVEFAAGSGDPHLGCRNLFDEGRGSVYSLVVTEWQLDLIVDVYSSTAIEHRTVLCKMGE